MMPYFPEELSGHEAEPSEPGEPTARTLNNELRQSLWYEAEDGLTLKSQNIKAAIKQFIVGLPGKEPNRNQKEVIAEEQIILLCAVIQSAIKNGGKEISELASKLLA